MQRDSGRERDEIEIAREGRERMGEGVNEKRERGRVNEKDRKREREREGKKGRKSKTE